MKKIIILNGTNSEIPIIIEAQKMGYYVVTTGNMEELPGHKISDEYIPADYSDAEVILDIVKKNNIGGIVSCANDFGVITSSYVAGKMGWKGHDTYENSVMMHHKDKLMQYFKENKIPAPWFEIFTSSEAAKEFCRGCKYPIIVKANDLTGGKGILKATCLEEAQKAIDNAFQLSRDKHILIEPFLEGKQQSIVVFLVNKKIVMTSSSDIFCMRNPYLVQAETYPASDFDIVKEQLHSIIHFMAEDLKLCDGILSFQYIVEDGVPYIIDMMRRCFGNETLRLADEMTGFPWERAYIMASLGMDCTKIRTASPTSKYCGHYGIMAKSNGVLLDYTIPEKIESKIFKKNINILRGERIENFLQQKIANIYFRYENYKEMMQDIGKLDDQIEIRIRQ